MRPGGRLGATIDAREFGFAVGVRGHWSLCPACNAWGSGAVTEPFLCPVPFFQVLAGPSERKASFRGRRVGAGGAVLGGCAVGRIARRAATPAAEPGKAGLQHGRAWRVEGECRYVEI